MIDGRSTPLQNGPVSVKDVAKSAGVSVGTVSMALNDNPMVAAKTRERVKALAEEMGYRRCPAFAAIGSRSRWSRAVEAGTPVALVHEARPDESPRSGPDETLRGMQETGARLGYRVEEFSLANGQDWSPLLRVLRARGFPAIVVAQMLGEKALQSPQWSDFVVVAVGQQTHPLPMHTVRFSRHMSTREAVLRVWERGYRRIGFLAGMHDTFTATEDFARLAGFVAGLREVGLCLEDQIPPLEHPIRRVPERRFRGWLRTHHPDAVISTNAWPTLGLLRKFGFRIPGDFAFAGLLGADESEIAHPRHSHPELGGAAIRQVDHLLRHGEYGLREAPLHIIVPATWIEGASLPEKAPLTKRKREPTRVRA